MSVCIFIASDLPLSEHEPLREYPVRIDVDAGTVDDTGADDNYCLLDFADAEAYTGRQHGVRLEWNYYTDGRARELSEYIRRALEKVDSVELWKVWLDGHFEYEQRPFVHRKTVSVSELTTEMIRELAEASIFNTPDGEYPERTSAYCLRITA